MYWFHNLYPSLSILLVSYTTTTTTTTAQLLSTATTTTATDELVSIVTIDNDCANIDCDDAKPASLPMDTIVNAPPTSATITSAASLLAPQQLLQQTRQLDRRHRNRRHQLTSDERHELQRRAMQDVVLHQQQQQQQHDKEQQPQHSSHFSSVREMRSFYYFHSGVIEIAAKNAIQMASSASASATLASSAPPDILDESRAADAAATVMDDENDILVIEDGMKDQEANFDEKIHYNYDANDFHEDNDGNDDDYLLYRLAQNAIENKLMQVEKKLEELMLVKQALVDKVGSRDEENHHHSGNHHDNLRPDLARANHDTTSCQRDNELPKPSESKLSMSMDYDDDDDDSENSKKMSIESDSDSCSNIHPAKANKKQVQHDGRSTLSSTTYFTSAEYTNIQHRLNCHSPHRLYRLVDGISLPDAVEKWRKMRQTFWKLFDIPIGEDDDDDNSINYGLGDHARASTFSSSKSSENVNGIEHYQYKYIPNPDLYVDLLSSSSSSPSFNTSSPSTSSETTFHIQRGLFAARDFEMGEVVYTQRKNAFYFQELSSWESYLHSLQQSSSLSSGSKTNNTSDDDDACLAMEWSFMKRISRPGRWLVMLVLDEGVYMRRNNVAINASAAATASASSAANENDVVEDIDDDDEDDDDDDNEWLEGNVALDDERSLDFVALRSIRMGEEIIDAGIDIDGGG